MLANAGNADPYVALDRQVVQKILPRLHGTRRRLDPILCAVGRFAFDLVADPKSTFDPLTAEGDARLPISFEKIRRMLHSARTNQFASFTE